MKRLFLFGVTTFLIIQILSCKSSYNAASVNYLSGTEQTVTVRVVGIGSNEDQAVINAEQKVFDHLLFRGLPESKQKMPLLGYDESAEKLKHKEYFDKFYSGQRHKSFVMASIPVSSLIKVKGGKSITVDVKVNLSALRGDLETFGVIRKFGL